MLKNDRQQGSATTLAMILVVGTGVFLMGQMAQRSQNVLNFEVHHALREEKKQIQSMVQAAASCEDPIPLTCNAGDPLELKSKTGQPMVNAAGTLRVGRWNVKIACRSATDKTFWVYASRQEPNGSFSKDPLTGKLFEWKELAPLTRDCSGEPKAPRVLKYNTCYGSVSGLDSLPYEVAKLCASAPPPPPPPTPWPSTQVSIAQVPSTPSPTPSSPTPSSPTPSSPTPSSPTPSSPTPSSPTPAPAITPQSNGGYTYPAPNYSRDYSSPYGGGGYNTNTNTNNNGGYDAGGGGGYNNGGGYGGGFGFEEGSKEIFEWIIPEAMAQSAGNTTWQYGTGSSDNPAYGNTNYGSSGALGSDAGCTFAGQYCGDWQIPYAECDAGYHSTYRYTDRFGWGGMDIAKYTVCEKDITP